MAQESVQQSGPLKGGRQRANHIQVHRIELGLKERKMAEEAFAFAAIPKALMGFAALAAAAGIGLAGYGLYWASKEAFNWGEKAAHEAEEWAQNTWAGISMQDDVAPEDRITFTEAAITGRAKYKNPKTGQVFTNPVAGVPFVGSLFGTGMNLGIWSKNKFG
jgi:hypothetical protein